jgi:chromate reductase, NAD(P)H dehydrogenase (quinone)
MPRPPVRNAITKELNLMEKLKILAIVGSLRRDSFNKQLALIAGELVKDSADFSLLTYDDVPLLNQDHEYPAPVAVRRVREAVKAADGIWFFTPEYNHTFPGVLKNLIDWLSRPVSETERQVLSQKPAAVCGVTPGMTGTACAQDQLVMLLSLLNMRVMNFPRVTIHDVKEQLDEAGKLRLTESLPFLEKQAAAFVKFLQKR